MHRRRHGRKRNKREKTIYTIGSGINYGEVYSTAMCWFMEMQWINSGCIHSGEYFHGPFEVTDYDVPFMLVKSIGHTRHLDERVENFAKKFTEDLLVLDQKDLDLSTVADEAKPYVAAILTGVVIRHFVEAIAFRAWSLTRCSSLYVADAVLRYSMKRKIYVA